MPYTRRMLEKELLKASRAFPAIIVTGPRRAGKTTLLRHLFPKAQQVLLEDPDVIARVESDPNGFLDDLRPPVILDEIQNTPTLFNYIRTRIDRTPRKRGQWLLTGSQEASLMKGVTESMAGRAATFQLLPFSRAEHPKVSLLRGGFPEVLQRPSGARTWFRSYLQTYLERDVRAVSAIRELSTFRRFLALLASRCGQLLNKSDMAAPLGVSVPTLTLWISILEITGQIILVPPFYENFGKRIVKSPKLYFSDCGLACHLLGISTEKALNQSIFLGPVFEGFVASEILKYQLNTGQGQSLYYFRDQQGLEVDFLVPKGEQRLLLLETKATKSPMPGMAQPLLRLDAGIQHYSTVKYLVCRTDPERVSGALTRGVRLATPDTLASLLR